MSRTPSDIAVARLFHPFESGELPLPPPDTRCLFVNAAPGFRLLEGFEIELTLAQGFRPDYLALKRSNGSVSPLPDGSGFGLVLMLCSRHRGGNELMIAEALERAAEGARIVVAGAKEEGIASLAKRVAELVAIDGRSHKHHGMAFWLVAPSNRRELAAHLRHANASAPVEGRFETAPGMFSHDRIDRGSRLLAEALPRDLSGKVADFCAGWGYVAVEVLERCPAVEAIDLYEADFASLEAARHNLAGSRPAACQFFWHDLIGEAVAGRYDAIVMNPPFHQGRAAEPGIGQRLIAVAAKALANRGRLLMVANKGLPYEKVLAASFARYEKLADDGGFNVFSAWR